MIARDKSLQMQALYIRDSTDTDVGFPKAGITLS